MPFKIVRNDITRMKTDAIVNTANSHVAVGEGCDYAVYTAAGYDKLLSYRKENIGEVSEGEAFITPGFNLDAKYIIHTVSPCYQRGTEDEEKKLRASYQNSLKLAKEYNLSSISFPLISTGSFGYPKEEGIRIAADEINSFLLRNDMTVYLVIFDNDSVELGNRIYPNLEEYIDNHYVETKTVEEYAYSAPSKTNERRNKFGLPRLREAQIFGKKSAAPDCLEECKLEEASFDFEDFHADKLEERMEHLTDTFSEYLLYLISERNMENSDVYKRAVVDKKTFSKIKNNPNYHPQKLTALCLCMGAKLNLDESKDLLARAGYALSPCDKTDIIFSYFIENEIYDMIELDIQLEEHGLPCIIE